MSESNKLVVPLGYGLCRPSATLELQNSIYLHRWCSQVDALQPALAEYCKDRGSLVYIQSMPPSATSVTHLSGHRPSHASFFCPQPWHLHGRWCVDEVARLKDCSRMPVLRFYINCGVFVAHFHASLWSHWFRPSFCSGWTMVTRRWLAFHPISPSGCSRCWILLLGLCFLHRVPNHATPDTVALAEGARAHQV